MDCHEQVLIRAVTAPPPPQVGTGARWLNIREVPRSVCHRASALSAFAAALFSSFYSGHADLSLSHEHAKFFLPRGFHTCSSLFLRFLSSLSFSSFEFSLTSSSSVTPSITCLSKLFPPAHSVSVKASCWFSLGHLSQFVITSVGGGVCWFVCLTCLFFFSPTHKYINFTKVGTECVVFTAVPTTPSRVVGTK